ncbi:flagellar export chaperone FlgN [Halanaerobaculum tunisiense]
MKVNLTGDGLIENLITNYKKKLLHYRQILSLTEKQQKVIEDEEWQDLSQLTADKEEIINKVKGLDTELEQGKEKLAQKSDLKAKAKIKNLKIIVDKAYEVMQEISKLEQFNQDKITAKQQEMQQQIRDVNTGLNINQAYNGQGNSYEGKFIDEKE